jgi:MAF protein
MELILASTSEFRASILQKLQLPFKAQSPNVDETPLADETPQALVSRLSQLKAQAVAATHPDAMVIGSDQVALFKGEIIGKPHTVDNAIKQLTAFSGHHVLFLTGLTLINSKTSNTQTIVEPFSVYFRKLNQDEIKHYVDIEQPLKCAGSFKSEGLGVCLFEKLDGDDPNSLIGLPLIQLTKLLANEGINVLTTPRGK